MKPADINGLPPLDYERSVIELAKKSLDDIPECRDSKFAVRWNQDTVTHAVVPFLTIEFAGFDDSQATPAIAVCLVSVQKGTLMEAMPGKVALSGDRLRDHILRSVHHYLNKHGIVITLPEGTEAHADL